MNAPFLWLILPLLSAIALAFWPRHTQRYPLGLGVTLFWLGLSIALPIDQVITLGRWRFKIQPEFNIIGRQLILTDTHRPLIWLSFGLLLLWLLGAWFSQQNTYFPALALGTQSLWLTALTVTPLLYAAFFIEAAVLGFTFFFARHPRRPTRGLQRYLILQTLALPLFLYTSWMLAGVETAPADLQLTQQALIFLSTSFFLLLPAFPFHIWAPQAADDLPPYILAFWLASFPTYTLLFGLRFLEAYPWLRETPAFARLLTLIGLLTFIIAGVLTAWQRRSGRLLAYATLAFNGVTLLALASHTQYGIDLLPRHLTLLALGYGLERLSPGGRRQTFRELQGAAYRQPLAAGLGVLGLLALAGLPLFSPFLRYYPTWNALTASNLWLGTLFALGLTGLTIGGLRLLAVLLHSPERLPWNWQLPLAQAIWQAGMFLLLLAPTLLPAWLQWTHTVILRLYPHLAP